MPPADYIQQSLYGAWRLMHGKKDGESFLDLTADGFWTSFFAIVVAVPALGVSWVTAAHEIAYQGDGLGVRLAILVRLVVIDLAAWIVPLAGFVALAGPLGLGKRVVSYVVASNWAGAIFVWIMLPPALVRLFWPSAGEGLVAVTLGLFVLTMVLSWRLTNQVIARGPAVATGVFAGMFLGSLAVVLLLQPLLGLGATTL